MKVGARFQDWPGGNRIDWPCASLAKQYQNLLMERRFVRISEKTYPGWSRWYASVK